MSKFNMQAETQGNGFVNLPSQRESRRKEQETSSQLEGSELHESSHLRDSKTLNNISNQGDAHGQGSLPQISAPEVLHEISARDVANMSVSEAQASQSDVTDISAPEIRSRSRSHDTQIVLLQSTFTQTLPVYEESKKPCHSVAVQTQFQSEFETPTYSVITGDGSVAYDSDGVRVLRAIGTWTPNYQGTDNFVEPNADVFINGSSAVTSPEDSMVQHSVSSSPNSSVHCMPSAPVAVHDDDLASQAGANKQASGDKAFVCPVCSKGLARKDKLVIHMRIHTGEKPYVCEVCERAFARRDKLVMHMNKLKHLTPSNIAPLGKRHHLQTSPVMSGLPDKRQDTKLDTQEMGSPASSVDIQPAALVQVVHDQPTMTWNCELCGRICLSRDEWTVHARSHLDGEHSFGGSSVSSSLSVLTPLSSYQYTGTAPDRQICVVCRQEFTNKTDLILHLRGHFVGKPELLANHVASLTDSSGVC